MAEARETLEEPILTGNGGPTDLAAMEPDLLDVEPDQTVASGRRRRSFQFGWWLACGWLILVVGAALLAPILPLWEPGTPDYTNVAGGLSASHPLGGDAIGRDNLSRLIYGARASLLVGLSAVVLGAVIGGLLGIIAGYVGGKVERVLLTLTDATLAFPGLVLLIAAVAVFGASMTVIIVGLAVLSIPTFIRLARATTLVIVQREFVTAARAYGARPMRVMLREVVPNVVLPVAAYGFIMVGVFIVAEGSLSFLGLGIPPPTPSWGSMIAAGRTELLTHPQISLIPAAVMFVTVLSINYVGERTRKRFEVKDSNL
ncbi:ABC transporter permease [Nakamurella leprariae]|uniref:ABC transporter permease n=1 Tax=Nakamurella leprariae TaxID=2803911 RepID=A0A938YGA6_9ACTN|nr:ABC transporter permease [Nakamurella leprariae]MBM9467594.1 ABC transporter permease [Nakamurella leprariae]